MSTRYYCDVCDIHLSFDEVNYSLEMTGKLLCSKHLHDIIDKEPKVYKLEKEKVDESCMEI